MALVDEIRKKSKVPFRYADPEELKQFRLLGAPKDAISFFEEHGPSGDCAEINKVRLLPIEEILGLAENSSFVLGTDIQLQPLGYLVFATTVYGDAFCFATNGAANARSAPIVLLAHDWELDESTLRTRLAELAKPVADSFDEFLQAWVEERLDLHPLYPEWLSDCY